MRNTKLTQIAISLPFLGAGLVVAQDREAATTPELLARVSVFKIAGQPISKQIGGVVELSYANEGFDVEVSANDLRESDRVFVLVKSQDSNTYHVFAAPKQTKEQSIPVWVARDVRLPDEGAQRKRFVIRAAVGPASIKTEPTDSLSQFTAVSTPPTLLAVLRWLPASHALRIETIRGVPMESQSPVSIEASGDVAGKRPAGQPANEHIYVVTHVVDSAFWRVSTQAELRDTTWLCRDVRFIEDGQPGSRLVDVYAIASEQPIPEGPILARDLKSKEVSWSFSVRVVVKDAAAPPAAPTVEIELLTYSTPAGIESLSGIQILKVATPQIGLNGTVKGLTQGKSIWCVLRMMGRSEWVIQEGPAIIAGMKWSLPNILLDGPGPAANAFQVYVISADSALSPGIAPLQVWQPSANGLSRLLLVERNASKNMSEIESSLRISRIGGAKVDAGVTEVVLPPDGPVEVESDLSARYKVWVGRADAGSDEWQFVPAAQNAEGVWVTPPLRWPRAAGSKDQDLVAIATPVAAAIPSGHSERWQSYAWRQSAYIIVSGARPLAMGAKERANWISGWGWNVFWLLIAIVIVALAVLWLLEWLWRLSSGTLDDISRYFDGVCRYLGTQVESMPKIDLVKSALGLFILGIGIFAIWSYFPIYQHVLRTVLSLSAREGHSLALLLIVCIALTGIVGDVTVRYGKPAAGAAPGCATWKWRIVGHSFFAARI